jgi:carboxypeptidase Q
MNLHRPLFMLSAIVVSQVPLAAQEKVDLPAIHRIRTEALTNSKVMEHMSYLTDVNGPRLAGSPGYASAGAWVMKRLKEYGLENVKQEKFPFGRGWTYSRFSAHLLEPSYQPLIGFPVAWTKGTDGVVTAAPVLAILKTEADLTKWKGKLKGAVVFTEPPRVVAMHTTPQGRRFNDGDLVKEELAPDPGASQVRIGAPTGGPGQPDFVALRAFRRKLDEFLAAEEVIATVTPGTLGDGGTVFVSGSRTGRDMKDKLPITQITLTAEHYNRIARLLEKKIPVKIELEVKAQFLEVNTDSYNYTGELPGGRKKDEIVMVGAHLDSWHSGTGATDNAAGSSVAIEAMRVLKASGLKLDRTIRIALWGGEEEGLLGSKAYVKEHFADPTKMVLTEQHAKISGYFNLDNGTGKIRGVYMQGNDMMRPIFETWFAPFKDLGAGAISIRNTGGTDHLSFDAVGIPGFQFIQDPIEYSTRTHHSNMDVYDAIQKGDLMQSSAIMASFLYLAANREEMLPRKPLPKATPERRPGEEPPFGDRTSNAPSNNN